MKQEINLEELFGIHFNGLHYEDITKEGIIKFGVDLAHKVLDLAAENAETGEFFVFGNSDDEDRISYYDLNSLECKVDENSILQIKDWIK